MCSYCDAAKVYLTNRDITYKVIDIMETKENYTEFTALQKRSVPQIIVDGINIGGYDDMIKNPELITG